MRTRLIHWWAIVLATALVGAFAGTASANRLSVTEQSFTASSVEGRFEDGEGGLRITCPITLSGSFSSRSFAKVRGTVIGQLANHSIGTSSCTGEGSVSVSTEGLPARFTYSSFTGTLPRITEVNFGFTDPITYINGYEFPPFICRYRYQAGDPQRTGIESVGGVRYLVIESLLRTLGEFGCPFWLRHIERAPVSSRGGAALSINLI